MTAEGDIIVPTNAVGGLPGRPWTPGDGYMPRGRSIYTDVFAASTDLVTEDMLHPH